MCVVNEGGSKSKRRERGEKEETRWGRKPWVTTEKDQARKARRKLRGNDWASRRKKRPRETERKERDERTGSNVAELRGARGLSLFFLPLLDLIRSLILFK